MPPLAGFWQRVGGQLIDGIITGVLSGAFLRLGWLAAAAYWIVLLTLRGQTVGMMAVGVRIVRAADGSPLDWARSAIRFLMSVVSGVCLGLGYLWAAWDPRRQTWHDHMAGTIAVQAPRGF